MYDYGLSVLEQYGLEADAARRGRGALICETKHHLGSFCRIASRPSAGIIESGAGSCDSFINVCL